jgi:hypothetical protein
MIERREDLRFALESGQALRVGGERRWEHLDRDLAPEFVVVGQVHLAHPAGSDQRADLVSTDAAAVG